MPWRPSDERSRDAELARSLRDQGLTLTQIGDELGLKRNTVSDLLHYPEPGTLYKRRRRQFKDCPKCGRDMAHTSQQCIACARGGG